MRERIRVLHVDDDPDFGDLAAEFLERVDERLAVVTEQSAADGLDHLDGEPPDCIVSDYEMPGQDGIEFLEAVRAEHPELPFILFTGKGSETVASDAISAGATDYLQKETAPDQFEVLANRIENVVQQHRSKTELERERSRMEFALESTDAAVWTRDVGTDAMEIHPDVCPVFGTRIESLEGLLAEVHPRDRDTAEETIRTAAAAGDPFSLQFRFPRGDTTGWGEMIGRTIHEDGEVPFQTGITRDITEQKEQKRRFEVLANNLPGMVYRCANAPEWPMEDVRGNVASFSGYTAAELESGRVSWGTDVIHPEDEGTVWETVQNAVEANDSFELTYRIRSKDGETRWVWERGRGVFGPDGDLEALEGFITDVTDRKRRERTLRRNERRFEALFHDPNILVGLLEPDGTVLNANDTAMDYLDEDRADVVGTPFPETPWWREDRRSDLAEWIERAAAGEYVEFEVEHNASAPAGGGFTAEGTLRPVTDTSDETVSIIASARDVTERKEQEAALRRIRDRTEFAFARTDAAIWELDDGTGEMTSYPDPSPLLDGSVETVEGFAAQIHEADRDEVMGTIREVIDAGESRTVSFRTAPGIEAEWVESQIEPVFDGAGSVSRVIGVSRDVTEDKRRERQLERQNERFDELASVVSHDLQAPISSVRGRLELAAETGDLEHVERASDALERLDELRGSLVEVLHSRTVVGERTEVDVGDLAAVAWERVDSRPGSELETHGRPELHADPEATQRLLQNLLSNAAEHSEGDVTVRVGGLPNGFYVEDDGPGIDPGAREDVFTPGYTTKPSGTGMGMASVAQIVDEHGWRIEVTDADHLDGARFEVTD